MYTHIILLNLMSIMKKYILACLGLLCMCSASFWLTPQEEYVDGYITNALSSFTIEKKTSILTNAEQKLQTLVYSIPGKDKKKPILELILSVVRFQLAWISTNVDVTVEASVLQIDDLKVDKVYSAAPNTSDANNNQITKPQSLDPQKDLLVLINQIRQENNLKPLTVSRTLETLAQTHVEEMEEFNYFNHTNIAWDDSIARVEKSWYTFTYVGETLAYNADTIEVVAYGRLWSDQWHREILLSPKATEIWIWYVGSKWIWTAVYANPVNLNTPSSR